MVKGFNITPIDNLIIDRICDLQIQSFLRLASPGESHIDVDLRRIGLKVSKQDVSFRLISDIEIYEDIKSDKTKFTSLDALEISHIKDMLLNYAEEFQVEFHPKQVADFWYKVSLLDFVHNSLN
jgi:hypothetical protein